MISLPNVVVTQNNNIVDISFYPDVPDVVKFHSLSILHNKFHKAIINKQLLEEVKKVINEILAFIYHRSIVLFWKTIGR